MYLHFPSLGIQNVQFTAGSLCFLSSTFSCSHLLPKLYIFFIYSQNRVNEWMMGNLISWLKTLSQIWFHCHQNLLLLFPSLEAFNDLQFPDQSKPTILLNFFLNFCAKKWQSPILSNSVARNELLRALLDNEVLISII